MSARRVREMEQTLLSKGFRRRDGDHRYFHLYIDGRRTAIWTKFSHGAGEYGDALLAKVRQQLRLTRTQFDDLMDCPMGFEGYVTALRERGELPKA